MRICDINTILSFLIYFPTSYTLGIESQYLYTITLFKYTR